MALLWTDDFESMAALATNYSTVTDCQSAAGVGVGGSWGFEGIGTNSQRYYGEIIKSVTPAGREGVAEFEFDFREIDNGTHDDSFGFQNIHVFRAPNFSHFCVTLIGGGPYTLSVINLSHSFDQYDYPTEVGDPETFIKVKVCWKLSSLDEFEDRIPDGEFQLYLNDVLIGSETGLLLGSSSWSGSADPRWNRVGFNPMGRGDNINIWDEVPSSDLEAESTPAVVTWAAVAATSERMSLCGADGVYVWMELQTDDGVKVYAKENLALDDTFKEGRVLSFGSVRRAFSRDRGGFETATASIELSDTDRQLRGLAATGTLLNKRCDIYASTPDWLRAGFTPLRVMQGIVRRYKPLPDLRFSLELEDFFGSRFSWFSGDRSIPNRLFTVDDFPNLANPADHPSSPGNPTLIGKPVPIGYGVLSDSDLYADSVGVVPAVFVGRRTVNSFDWDEYVLFGHAVKAIDDWFASASEHADDLPRELMPDATEGIDFLIPGYAGWLTHVGTSDMYRDFNGNRYTVIYARGPRSDAAREGKVPLTFNVQAIEDTGDGTGTLITSLPEQIEHLICNWVLQSYTSGDWPAIPTVGTPPIDRWDTTSTDTVKAITELRITGGYQGAFMLAWDGQFHTIRDLVADACRSCDLDIGLNHNGQLFMSMIDSGTGSVKAWGDVIDVLRGSFDIDRDFDRLANRFEYRYRRQYIKPVTELLDVVASGGSPVAQVRLPDSVQEEQTEWLTDYQVQEDATSIADHEETRLYDLNLPMVRHEATADDVVGQMLARLKNGPVHATWTVDLCGTDVELGDNNTLTEYQGLSETGWTDRLLRNEEHTVNLDALTVTLVARDLE